MIENVRVPMSRFKYNMKPYIESAAKGETVIVTSNGKDKFKITPCVVKKPKRMPPGTVPDSTVDLDEPGFLPSAAMKVILDSSVWWKWTTGQTMRAELVRFLKHDVSEFFLTPVSVMEIFYAIQTGRVVKPDFPDWENFVGGIPNDPGKL